MRCVKCNIDTDKQIELKSLDGRVTLKHMMCEMCFDKMIDHLYNDEGEEDKK